MTARVIGRSLYLRAEIRDGAAINNRCPPRGQMIAPCVRNGKCFDESDHIRIERPQSGGLQAAPLAVAISPFFYVFHAAPITLGVSVVERARRL